MSLFKSLKRKRYVKEEQWKIFEEMKKSKTKEEFLELQGKYMSYDRIAHPGGRINNNMLIGVLSNLAMLGLVLHYEKLDIIYTKAWAWIKPNKI